MPSPRRTAGRDPPTACCDPPPAGGRTDRFLPRFFRLVFAFALPFWILGALADAQVLPGLRVAALMAVCPAVAALIWRQSHGRPARHAALLARLLGCNRIRSLARAAGLYVPILPLDPCAGRRVRLAALDRDS